MNALEQLQMDAKPLRLRYTPFVPTAKQYAFLKLDQREVFYGGAAGGGKSYALLMGALQYVDVPGYAALILRKSYADFTLPGALMDIAHQWLDGTDAHWVEGKHRWEFPGGGKLQFGYLDAPRDKYRYQSAAFHYIGFDELTHFRHEDYLYMFSRCRRPADALRGLSPDGHGAHNVPLRVRSASNPGGYGHEWVNMRFVDPETRHPDAIFMPAKLSENEHLDYAEYIENLEQLGTVERLRLLEGDWEATDEGVLFHREWFQSTEDPHVLRTIRYWDTAATEVSETNTDPDWTVGTLMGRRQNGEFVILDIERFRGSPAETDRRILACADRDGRRVEVWIQEEPGSASKLLTFHYQKLLEGHIVKAHRVGRNDGDKFERAKPFASAAEKGLVTYLPGTWIHEWLREHAGFPNRAHDDQVDSAAGAHYILSTRQVGRKNHTRTPNAQLQVARTAYGN